MKLYLDTETCGLHGMIVLIQYAINDGPVILYDPWNEPVQKTLALLRGFCGYTVVGFNLAFDWFHVNKLHSVLALCPGDWIPSEHIDEIALLEPQGQDGAVLKPAGALDLMLHSRKGPYQSLMNRDPIRIRRVPTAMAGELLETLERDVHLDGIYFAKRKKAGPCWESRERLKRDGSVERGWRDLLVNFRPSGALKVLAQHALGETEITVFAEIELDKRHRPVEYGYAPTALAASTAEQGWACQQDDKGREGFAWPGVIGLHIAHWRDSEPARKYARKDVIYLQLLDKHFGYPAPSDDDSILACMVGILRWRGYAIDKPGIEALLAKAEAIVAGSPINVNRPSEVRAYLSDVMDDTEAQFIESTTGKEKLEAIEKSVGKWRKLTEREPCAKCCAEETPDGYLRQAKVCMRCGCKGYLEPGEHPATVRARELLKIKRAKKEIELYKKLLRAGKLHADFVIIGAKSSRMSGAGGVNAQAIKRDKNVRACFQLAWEGYQLCGGDFDGFEVTIAEAVYNDPELRKTLLTIRECAKCNGTGQCEAKNGPEPCKQCEGEGRARMKIHALFGEAAYGIPYDEICASEGTLWDMYTRAKSGVFLDMYGGEADRLAKTLGISVEEARRAQLAWQKRFPGIGEARKRIAKMFGCMDQPGGKGTAIFWNEPQDAARTLLGFPRFFTVENRIVESLYNLAETYAARGRDSLHEKVVRDTKTGREQTAEGAAASAVFGAAYGVTASNIRAAGNHEIQGTGAGICKALQRAIWDLQPTGLHILCVAPMNVHDELMCPALPEYIDPIADVVVKIVESFRPQVPLIGMTWFKALGNWSGKKGGCAWGKVAIGPSQVTTPHAATDELALAA